MTRLHPVPSPQASSEKRLNSWKEIAAYLNRTTRTVMRWERNEGLPVHRHEHGKRGSVYAYTTEIDQWWENRRTVLDHEEERAPTQEPEHVPSGLSGGRRTYLALAGVTVIVAAVLATWLLLEPRPAALSFAARDCVLVADFENETGDPVFDRSLWTAFVVSLQQSPHANVFPPARLRDVLRRMGKGEATRIDETLGREICQREDIRGLIVCSISKAGQRFALSARLVDPQTGETVRAHSERPPTVDRVIESLDRVARKIREDLGESLVSIRANTLPLPQVTTTSLQALRAYAEGEFLWRKGEYKQAVKLFENSVAQDPGFAMAYAALGRAKLSHVLSEPDEGRRYYEKALQNSNRVTERERLFIQASQQASLDHFEEAAELFRLYVRSYPDDGGARYDFGTLLMLNDRPEEAIEQLKEAIRLAPESASAHVNLATAYVKDDKPQEALTIYAKAFELEPSWLTLANLNHEYGFTLVAAGQVVKARETFELALGTPDTRAAGLRSVALLDMYEGKYQDARARLEEAIAISRAKGWTLTSARNHLYLSILLDGQGDRTGRLKELDRAHADMVTIQKPPAWLPARLGIGLAGAGAAERAQLVYDSLQAEVDRKSLQDSSLLHLLEGSLALARRDYARATEVLMVADKEFNTPETIAALAEAYDRGGDLEHAAEYYAKLVAVVRPALGWEPQQPWLAAHVRLAELYAASGETAKASDPFNRFSGIWNNADRNLPLVRRMQRLRENLRNRH